jgi:hypothetical protein
MMQYFLAHVRREQGVSLPSEPIDFHVTVEKYLKSFKNENAAAKKNEVMSKRLMPILCRLLFMSHCVRGV